VRVELSAAELKFLEIATESHLDILAEKMLIEIEKRPGSGIEPAEFEQFKADQRTGNELLYRLRRATLKATSVEKIQWRREWKRKPPRLPLRS
jgi:hypothetical protein